MRTILLVLISIIVSSCMTIPTNYAGQDVGYAVIGIGQSKDRPHLRIDSYNFLFRRIGDKHKGWFFHYGTSQSALTGFFSSRKTKFYNSSNEAGIVEIATLQPGLYEILNFQALRFQAGGPLELLLPDVSEEVSIPFEVKAGQVIYLGNYQANRMSKKRDIFFIVEDRFARDLALAKMRVTTLPVGNAQDATPDVEKVGNRFLISTTQAEAKKAANPGVQP